MSESIASSDAHGSCLCGTVRYEIHGAFERFFLCHCRYCQKDTGSAHGANLFSTSATLKWLSGEDNVRTFCLPATRHSRSFCVTCGSALPGMQMEGKLLVVPAGSLDSAISQRPDAHLYMASKAAWDEALETLPQLDGLP
ncbi:MAG: aldehyde-activating protein [Pseudomonadales bacterium]|nr:aldehyde-activating protein [Pseudomonadales bacterium]